MLSFWLSVIDQVRNGLPIPMTATASSSFSCLLLICWLTLLLNISDIILITYEVALSLLVVCQTGWASLVWNAGVRSVSDFSGVWNVCIHFYWKSIICTTPKSELLSLLCWYTNTFGLWVFWICDTQTLFPLLSIIKCVHQKIFLGWERSARGWT